MPAIGSGESSLCFWIMMKITFTSVIALAISLVGVSGFSDSTVDFSQYPWIAPKSTDLRGPCPGLNTLTNHGFLPRDGRGLTVENVVKAAHDGYNIQPDIVVLAAKVGLTASAAENSSFTLADIRLHNSIEHDASVSRADFFTGDNYHFNATIFQTLNNSNPGVDYFNATSAGEVMRLRLLDSQKSNPTLINTDKEFTIRLSESALYLSVMGNATTGTAPKEFVRIFFQEERLPIAEGWNRSLTPISVDTVSGIAGIIAEASQWSANTTQHSSVVLIVDANVTFTV